MKSLIESLSSPHIVAYFQRICGLQWKYADPEKPIFPLLIRHQEKADAIVIKNKYILRVMQIGSELAAESFYYTFLPICSWILDIGVARKTLTSLALVMYTGQSAKDIFREKRPSSPPVIRLESKYETEYGMPSTHAMAGTVAPFALYSFARSVYQIPETKCFAAACTWASWVAISRIYLGMHTVSQVLVGVAAAGSLLYVGVPVVNSLDKILVNNNTAMALATAVSIILSAAIFNLDPRIDPETGHPRWNTARGDQAEIMGFTSGFLLGSKWAILHDLYIHRCASKALIQIPHVDVRNAILKMVIGGFIILPFFAFLRKVTVIMFAKLSNISLEDRSVAKRHPRVELPYKFLSSLFAGTLSSSMVPWVIDKLHLW